MSNVSSLNSGSGDVLASIAQLNQVVAEAVTEQTDLALKMLKVSLAQVNEVASTQIALDQLDRVI